MPHAIAQHDQPEIDTLLRDAGSSYLALARDAADAFADAKVLVPIVSGRGPAVRTTPATSIGNPPWIIEWSQGLQPIGHELEQAVDFLLDVVDARSTPAT